MQALAPHLQAAAETWAARLDLPLEGDSEFALQLGEGGLQLVELGPQAPGPVKVDFVEGAVAHRRLFGGGSGQMIAKAVGVQSGVRPTVLDATAGLGRDAFVLASLGCRMTLIERQPLIAALLEEFRYGADGSFQSGTLADYLMPTTCEAPDPVIVHLETPSPFTPLGAKGLGEGNNMSTPPCIANAVADALGRSDIRLPLTPSKVRTLIGIDEPPRPAGRVLRTR